VPPHHAPAIANERLKRDGAVQLKSAWRVGGDGWAHLLWRVFGIDLEHCLQLGGEFKIIAAIEEPAVIFRTLTWAWRRARRHLHPSGGCLSSRRLDRQDKSGCAAGLMIRRGP